MIVYICGPITGIPNLNREAFEAAQSKLLEAGHHPLNPHVICRDIVAMHTGSPEELWTRCMKRDITELLKAEAIVLLDKWWMSRGCNVEISLAKKLGIPIYELEKFIERYGKETKLDFTGAGLPESKL